MKLAIVNLVMIVVVLGVFMALYDGTTPQSADTDITIETPGERDCSGITGSLECFAAWIKTIVSPIWQFFVLLARVLSFDVPGAPAPIRVIVGAYFGINAAWIAASYARGVRA